jgi:hypothetical protein
MQPMDNTIIPATIQEKHMPTSSIGNSNVIAYAPNSLYILRIPAIAANVITGNVIIRNIINAMILNPFDCYSCF